MLFIFEPLSIVNRPVLIKMKTIRYRSLKDLVLILLWSTEVFQLIVISFIPFYFIARDDWQCFWVLRDICFFFEYFIQKIKIIISFFWIHAANIWRYFRVFSLLAIFIHKWSKIRCRYLFFKKLGFWCITRESFDTRNERWRCWWQRAATLRYHSSISLGRRWYTIMRTPRLFLKLWHALFDYDT